MFAARLLPHDCGLRLLFFLFQDTSIPPWARSLITSLDGVMIRLVAFLRRRPLFRLLLIAYLILFHLWFIFGLVFFAPSPTA